MTEQSSTTEVVNPPVMAFNAQNVFTELMECKRSKDWHWEQRQLAESRAERLQARVTQLETAAEHFRATGDPHQLYFALGWRPATRQELKAVKQPLTGA